MKLSVVIVNYNVKYFIWQCINSVLASKLDFEYEIIVVDNNSGDSSIEYLQQQFNHPHIKYILNNHNCGFSRANNQAIKIAKGQYILLLNPDTIVGSNVINNVCNFMDNHSEAGAIGVKMINGSGIFLPESKRGYPSPWASFCKMSGLAALFQKSTLFGQYNLGFLDKDKIHEVPILAGAFMLIPQKVLDSVGLLDEAFFMYGEDIDLSYRIIKAGYKNYYLPETIIHYKGESTNKWNSKYHKAFYDAMRIFYKKHHKANNKLFSTLILGGIQLKSIGQKLYMLIKQKKDISRKKTITFDKSKISYDEIIKHLNANPNKGTTYHIYYPETDIAIGTNHTKLK